MSGWLIFGIALLVTAIFTLAVSISARKIDFGSRMFRDKPERKQITFGGIEPKSRKSKAKRSAPPPPPSPLSSFLLQ
jgi:hypothetical protein